MEGQAKCSDKAHTREAPKTLGLHNTAAAPTNIREANLLLDRALELCGFRLRRLQLTLQPLLVLLSRCTLLLRRPKLLLQLHVLLVSGSQLLPVLRS